MIPGYTVRNIPVTPGLVLSPMSGVTTSSFRRLIKELNPGSIGLVVSEFVSVEGMTRGARKTLEMLRFHESERPYCIQIFGYDPQRMADGAKIAQDVGADIVDINCGCPAPKVVRKGGGCELMRQPSHLKTVFNSVKRAITVPLTMKMRSGWDAESINAPEIAKIAEGEGIEAIAVHGRTRAQLYRGEADWNIVREVSQLVSIPVLGSGDVVDRPSAEERCEYGARGLYIGRAALNNPYVFSEINTGISKGLRGNDLLTREVLLRYADLLMEEMPEYAATGKLKQLASQICKGQQWRKKILFTHSIDEQRTILKNEDLESCCG